MGKYKEEIQIEGKTISLHRPTYFVADIAANHDGDLERAKKLIYLAAESGADAVKFQHFNASTIVSDYGFKNLGQQKSHQSKWKKSVYEIYEDASLNTDWNGILKETSQKVGVTFFTSPYSLELVDQIDPLVPAYKIGSGDITWLEIVEHIAKKKKPVMIAAGASTLEEVEMAVNKIAEFNNQIMLMQCNTNYTASLENFRFIQLNVLKDFARIFPGMILGLSDHTPGHSTVLGAVTLGARVIEKHFTDDNACSGPDHLFSMNPASWKEMVDRTRELELALGDTRKRVEDNERDTVVLQRRAIRLGKDITKNHVISRADLEVLRPCPQDAIPPYEITKIVGKAVGRDLKKGEYLKWDDIKT